MIKVLFHIDTLGGGGAEKVLCNLVNHMDQTKFDITIQTVYPDAAEEYLVDGVHYKYIYPSDNQFYRNVYRVEAALGLVYPLHMKDDYDLEIAYLEFGPTKVIASSTNKKAKKIAWVHCDFDIAIKEKEAFIKKAATQYQQYDKIACVSEKCKESFVTMFGNDPEVVVIHNVIDDKEIIEKAEQPLPSIAEKRKLTMCAVGRLSAPKNYIRLLKTANRLYDEGYDFDLWMVGDGEQRDLIEEFISKHEMNSYVKLMGFQKNPYPFMKASDLLVCSSDYEGFSTFVAEGLILGKPIITTDCSGMRELLGESEYGMIVSNDDKAFYEGLKTMLSFSNERMKEYAEKSSKRGRKFSTDYLVKNTELYFDNICIHTVANHRQ